MNPQEISYALAKQVPDMARGFGIATGYGDIIIPPGWMAERIAQHVRRVLECELLGQAPTPSTMAEVERVTLSGQAAAQWLDDYATGKLATRAAQPLPTAVLNCISHDVHQSCSAPTPEPVQHGQPASPAQAALGSSDAAQLPAPAASPALPVAGGVPAAPTGCGLLPSPFSESASWGCAGSGDSWSSPEVN